MEKCNAPDKMQGEYRLVIRGRKICLYKLNGNKPMTKVKACCHKDDAFNLMDGLRVALFKMILKLYDKEFADNGR